MLKHLRFIKKTLIHVGDVAGVIRVAATGRRNTPDLYEILQVLGKDEVMKRFDEAIESLRG